MATSWSSVNRLPHSGQRASLSPVRLYPQTGQVMAEAVEDLIRSVRSAGVSRQMKTVAMSYSRIARTLPTNAPKALSPLGNISVAKKPAINAAAAAPATDSSVPTIRCEVHRTLDLQSSDQYAATQIHVTMPEKRNIAIWRDRYC